MEHRQPEHDYLPEQAWRVAQAFLENQVLKPDGEPLGDQLARFMMVGLYAGVRMTLLDPEFGQAIAAQGNAQESVPCVSVRQGMVRVFGQVFAHHLMHDAWDAGFTNPEFYLMLGDNSSDVRKDRPVTQEDAELAVDEVIKMFQRGDAA